MPQSLTRDLHEKIINKTSYSGVDIRIYAVINDAYNLDYQAAKKKVNDEFKQTIDDAEQNVSRATDAMTALFNANLPVPVLSNPLNSLNDSQKEQYFKTLPGYNTILDNQGKFNTSMAQTENIIFKELAEIQTLSYSIYRDKEAVRTLGETTAKGFTRAGVTVAGTMIFTVIDERILHELAGYSLNEGKVDLGTVRVDQLPPLDIFVTFENESGSKSRMGIFGVEFLNEGQVMSVADLITENSVNYVARHISPMRKVETRFPDQSDLSTSGAIYGVPVLAQEYELAMKQVQELKKRWL